MAELLTFVVENKMLAASIATTVGSQVASHRQTKESVSEGKKAQKLEQGAAKARTRAERVAQVRRAQAARASVTQSALEAGIGTSSSTTEGTKGAVQTTAASNVAYYESQFRTGALVSAKQQDAEKERAEAGEVGAVTSLGNIGITVFNPKT